MTLTALLLALAAASQGTPPAAGAEITRDEVSARLAQCGSRRFESVALFEVDGNPKRSRLELCAPDSDSDAQWIATLEKNEAIVKAQTRLPETARFKLLLDLRTEIDRLKAAQATANRNVPAVAGEPSAAVAIGNSGDFAISALPPIPAPPKAPPSKPLAAANGEPSPAAFGDDISVASQVAGISQPSSIAKLSASSAAATKKPLVSLFCASPDVGRFKCASLSVSDGMELRADEDLSAPLTLAFQRKGSEEKSLVRLARLKNGESVRLKVPSAICKRRFWTEFTIQVSGAGPDGIRYLDSLGPFRKRC